MTAATSSFPIDLAQFKPLAIDPFTTDSLSDEQLDQLKANVQLCRDAIVFFTAIADAKGLGGHTGGPYDIVPEVLIADAFMRGSDAVVPIYFDEAGHRVAIQYLMSVLNGEMEPERLLHYREYDSHLPGHPERGFTEGVKFSSGRLGHMWPFCNGVAMANPDKCVFVFGSDGSQMEGDDAEAARLAVAQHLNIKLVIDNNDVIIAGHPSEILPGFDVGKTLEGHGMTTDTGDGEDYAELYERMAEAVTWNGPVALINNRKMAVGIEGLEGSNHGHDVIKTATAIEYLEARGLNEAADFLKTVEKTPSKPKYPGTGDKAGKNRDDFGKLINIELAKMSEDERKAKVMVIDSDLEGSCGLHHIRKEHPEVYVASGIMERGNYSAAAGFGYEAGKQGIFGTFSAFLEMCISEITMARLNQANVLAHFSHAGVDDMADNTCHFGINNFFADNGIPGEGDHADNTRLYMPGDANQMKALIPVIFNDPGLRFVFTTRSAVPNLVDENGNDLYGDDYVFTPGKDEILVEGTDGYIVSFGETLHRAYAAVHLLKEQGKNVGLVNKPTLNTIDEEVLTKIGQSPAVLVAEGFNVNTGLGRRLGTELLKRGLTPKYNHIGTHLEGSGGLWRQMDHQGLAPEGITNCFLQSF